MAASLAIDGYAKHPTNHRIYVCHALGAIWHITKRGHGHTRTHTGKLGKRTTRFVATERTFRGRVIARTTLHELVAALQAAEQLQAAQQALWS